LKIIIKNEIGNLIFADEAIIGYSEARPPSLAVASLQPQKQHITNSLRGAAVAAWLPQNTSRRFAPLWSFTTAHFCAGEAALRSYPHKNVVNFVRYVP
jgi:hypothetical protein